MNIFKAILVILSITAIIWVLVNGNPYKENQIKLPAKKAFPKAERLESFEQPPEEAAEDIIINIIGRGQGIGFDERLREISKLALNLRSEDLETLLSYIATPAGEIGLEPGQEFALKNQILNYMRDQKPPILGLTEFLLKLRQDESQPYVIRDYAVQHLSIHYNSAASSEKDAILKELWIIAKNPMDSYAGTALISLYNIYRSNPEIDEGSLIGVISEAIKSADAALPARISAIQLAGQIKMHNEKETIERVALSESLSLPLRIAAISSLGDLGDLSGIRELALNENSRIKSAMISVYLRSR